MHDVECCKHGDNVSVMNTRKAGVRRVLVNQEGRIDVFGSTQQQAQDGSRLQDSHPMAWNGSQYSQRHQGQQFIIVIVIKCFHNHPSVEAPSTSIFYSNMQGPKGSKIGNTVPHGVRDQWRNIESHAVPDHAIGNMWLPKKHICGQKEQG